MSAGSGSPTSGPPTTAPPTTAPPSAAAKKAPPKQPASKRAPQQKAASPSAATQQDSPSVAAGVTRDSQRGKVYAAQHLVQRIFDRSTEFPIAEVAGSRVTLPIERKFADIASVQRYLDAVLALDWVRRSWPRARIPVFVRERRGQQLAHYQRVGAVIAVPLHRAGTAWAMRELVILHELAHHLTAVDEADHGPGFVANYLGLTGEVIGPEAALLLRVTLLDLGVRPG